MANRIVDSARSVLNKFIPDIYIYTDHMKGDNSGNSPGFELTLVLETMNGTFLCKNAAGGDLQDPPSQHHLIRLPAAVVLEMSSLHPNMQHREDLHQHHADLTSLLNSKLMKLTGQLWTRF
ncbi:probable RNA 3'-terminal phosphate cyclase-like protein [Coregonus clupeaformis]|uniref:probable RNA 3'-terminal phosphate cyclase-like protein n=1 Tax=Coregonus clupeaformis TaxID=59861 RepID=UPI001E1C53FF|nr:probable RNA 3'-terminal phosphate cyclase-like protein [Coregonus clupeaformis]